MRVVSFNLASYYTTYSMNPTAPRRAGTSLLAFLASPSCRRAEQRLSQRTATHLHHARPLTTVPRRYQQSQSTVTSTKPQSTATSSQPQSNATSTPTPPPKTPPPTQAASNAQKVSHELSPSEESDPLRSLTDGLDEPLLSEDERQVDWARSYHGLSSSPFTAEQADILMRKIEFDDIEIKPDGIIYLPEIKYRRILNRAFGPGGWGLAPRGETIVTNKIVTREYGLVAGGRLVSIARGEQQYFDPDGVPTATEGCKSNALMRCCKDLGVASELWDPRFIKKFMAEMGREVIVEHVTTKKRRKHFMRKDDELKYPFKEVTMGFGGSQQQGAAVKK